MKEFPKALEEKMIDREKGNLKRTLNPPCGIDFTSNDYFGFSHDLDLRHHFDHTSKNLPLTASGSRLLRGELGFYQEVEKTCAQFSNQEAALLYPSGYQANIGLFSSILGPNDQVFSDELNHASIIDGIKLSRAQKYIYKHCDTDHLESLLSKTAPSPGLRIMVTESIFSMDGSIAPVLELVKLSKKYDAAFIVDEAHATGLFRSGLVEKNGLSDQVFATIHTGGKALGSSGAWVAGSEKLRDYLIQFSRAFIYSTAPFPLQALSLKLSIEHCMHVGEIRSEQLFKKIELFQDSLSNLKDYSSVVIPEVRSPIIPVILGDTKKTLMIAEQLQARGFDVRAIRPPTVSEGTSRLRIILHSYNSDDNILALSKSLHSILESEGAV